MNRTTNENTEAKHSFNEETTTYGYEGGYTSYNSGSSTPMNVNEPLPGQPPLPPMPPPPGALPPMPHVFSTMPQLTQLPQVTQIQSWAHAAPTWQWMTPPTAVLPSSSSRDMTPNNMQTNRGKYPRRERFIRHSTNNIVYPQRNNFHRKNRRPPLHHHHHHQVQQHPNAYYGQTLAGGIGIDWQRGNFTAQGDALVNQMVIPIASLQSGVSMERKDSSEPDIRIVPEVSTKKSKQRKPMSQNYPSRPWNREDAQSALKVENEYNKTVRAQSLIIKFPDPDLNKEIVREFHSGIQNIHFQSPSGPRYCFIQMAENVDLEEAIKELERIPFGIGHLKVERKSLRDEDFPLPEEIDPYTLYVGNLPESVNVNEVKSKFPTATRVDVGYAQKMRNTRYAFIRYTTVEESIAAYKKAHDLMWDTRSIIVRFRRQRGNTCLPGEPKSSGKRVKEDPEDNEVKKEEKPSCNGGIQQNRETDVENCQYMNTSMQGECLSGGNSARSEEATGASEKQKQLWKSNPFQAITDSKLQINPTIVEIPNESVLMKVIKEEPEDYDEMSYIPMDDDDSDDENDVLDEIDDTNDEIDENDNEHDDDPDVLLDGGLSNYRDEDQNSEVPDHLDHMFNELENIGDIEL